MEQASSSSVRAWVLLIVVLSFITGCAAPMTIDVGYHGSDRNYAAALMAADAWNSTCGVELVNVHRGEGEVRLYEQGGTFGGTAWGETHLSRPVLGAIGPKEPTEIGFTDNDWALATLTHEFGHALGLVHEPTGIMKPGAELEQLDPATGYRTLMPGLISPEDCARAIAH